jgi:hypothetical protein
MLPANESCEQPWKAWWTPCGSTEGFTDGHIIRPNSGNNAPVEGRMQNREQRIVNSVERKELAPERVSLSGD